MSDKNNAKLEEEIKEMARLSILSNKINEVQEKNLKMFPFIFFNDVKAVSIDYDLSNERLIDSEEDKKEISIKYKLRDLDTSHFRVSYFIDLDKEKNAHVEKRFDALKKAVTDLFWNDIKVEVHFNKELVYSSANGKK